MQLSEEEKNEFCARMGENLKRLRRIGGLTQNDLEERSGISKERISKMESGAFIMRWVQFNSFLMVFMNISATKDYLLSSGILTPRLLQTLQGKAEDVMPDIDVPTSAILAQNFYSTFQNSRDGDSLRKETDKSMNQA